MDIKTTAIHLSTHIEFTDETGHRFTVDHGGVRMVDTPKGGVYVYVKEHGYPEFYMADAPVTVHVPEAKFAPGDTVVAKSGKGSVYNVDKVARDRYGIFYVFDNGSVDVRKRARSGRHYATDADKGYKKLSGR